jgi:hypothetical protein
MPQKVAIHYSTFALGSGGLVSQFVVADKSAINFQKNNFFGSQRLKP